MTDSTDDVDWHDGDCDEMSLESAVAWAYQKLVAFGVGRSERDALMMDRLKIFTEYGE